MMGFEREREIAAGLGCYLLQRPHPPLTHLQNALRRRHHLKDERTARALMDLVKLMTRIQLLLDPSQLPCELRVPRRSASPPSAFHSAVWQLQISLTVCAWWKRGEYPSDAIFGEEGRNFGF
jgi:hypothetical protein